MCLFVCDCVCVCVRNEFMHMYVVFTYYIVAYKIHFLLISSICKTYWQIQTNGMLGFQSYSHE